MAHVRGQSALAAKDYAKALELLEKANLRKDKLAQAYLAGGNAEKAQQQAKDAVAANTGHAFPLAVQVDVLYAAGKKDEAKATFEALRACASRPDLDVPVFARLAPIAKEFGFGDDWRVGRKDAADVGQRPSLDSLGPFRWHPSPAADWQLPTADGGSIGLRDYRGKPVVVLFYLGHGCVHCTEQLNAFAPLAKEYEQAGISLVAVSTDTVDALGKSLNVVKKEGNGPYPIPLVSDAAKDVFKKYHAYDDFENLPLHGTFLVDGRGMVRWQDVAAEPFADAKFLLAEAKRLLAQGDGGSARAGW